MKKELDVILNKWAKLINQLKTDEEKLNKTKNYYDDRKLDIIMNTDFNKLYKKNNDKVRKYHVRKKLKNTIEQKEMLELKIEDSKRKISFLKASTYAVIAMMELEK